MAIISNYYMVRYEIFIGEDEEESILVKEISINSGEKELSEQELVDLIEEIVEEEKEYVDFKLYQLVNLSYTRTEKPRWLIDLEHQRGKKN